MDALQLTGRDRSHVVQWTNPRFAAHPEAVSAFLKMREAAREEGIDLLPYSAFRDIGSQCRIWNMKFLGQWPLYDASGVERNFADLTVEQRIDGILCWSAIPGGSRHHWGSDIDVVDGARIPPGHQIKLLPEETEPGGIFYELRQWLDKHMAEFDFFRPYARYQGGMYGEPWHLSYAPVSEPALNALSLDVLAEAVESAEVEGKRLILDRLPEIHEKYVGNICR